MNKLLIILFFLTYLYGCATLHKNQLSQLHDPYIYKVRGDHYVFLENNYDKAILSYKEAIKNDSSYVDAYVGLGHAYWLKHMDQEAIEAYSTAIALNPDFVLAYSGLGFLYFMQGDHKKAIDIYKVAIQKYDEQIRNNLKDFNEADYIQVNYNLAKAYENIDSQKALVQWEKCIDIVKNSKGTFQRGMILEAQQAIERLRKIK